MRIVIAEDQLLLREGLVALLTELGFDVVAAVVDAEQALEAHREHSPDLTLLDIRMPPTHTDEGVRAALRIRAGSPGAPVMLLSQYVEHLYLEELLSTPGGGLGYLLKDRVFDAERFGTALRTVAAGGTVVDPSVVENLLERRTAQHALDALTPRELDVLGAMAQGLSNTDIAELLVVTDKAVAKHINSIFSKLDLPTDAPSARRVSAVLAYLRA